MNYEYSCDKSAISLVNKHLCRPLSSHAGRVRTSKCRSNRTKLNIDDSILLLFLYFLHYLSVCNVIHSGFFSNVCDIYVCYMLNKITYLLTY